MVEGGGLEHCADGDNVGEGADIGVARQGQPATSQVIIGMYVAYEVNSMQTRLPAAESESEVQSGMLRSGGQGSQEVTGKSASHLRQVSRHSWYRGS